jgi:hypothetical protein
MSRVPDGSTSITLIIVALKCLALQNLIWSINVNVKFFLTLNSKILATLTLNTSVFRKIGTKINPIQTLLI